VLKLRLQYNFQNLLIKLFSNNFQYENMMDNRTSFIAIYRFFAG